MTYSCTLCPRMCQVDRHAAPGFCGTGPRAIVARAAPHLWEEPPISGERGSGTVFFSGCSLRCVFCQNYDISLAVKGKEVTPAELRGIFDRLIGEGVHNINLVTATHFTDAVLEALSPPLPVPVVWNTGGYERVETLKKLEGKVQIYLPDMKYALSAPAVKYSHAPDYPEVAKKAILEMVRQMGPYRLDEDGLLKRGVILRHLVLPGNLENTFSVLDWVSETFAPGEILFSLMSQYTPYRPLPAFPELNRRLTAEEYAAAIEYMETLGIEDGFYQELSSAQEEYTPEFDGTGVEP
ncbi:MAG: radical SAM protein [bacterium]